MQAATARSCTRRGGAGCMIRDRVESIVIAALKWAGESQDIEGLENPTSETRLFGENGLLGSLGMINLILELEETLYEEYQVDLVIADEKALSMKRSPFRDVASLVDYITALLENPGD